MFSVMPNESVLILYFLMWYFLVGLGILFIISGIDDVFIDVYYWIRQGIRAWTMRHCEPLTYEKLLGVEEQLIAVLIPCWQEANVIATMLQHNANSIDYCRYYFFVGVYPNDPDTVAEVERVALLNPKVRCVIGATPGPTSKAANLNGIYQRIKQVEVAERNCFQIFVFHDCEDIIHPLSFKLYNYLIPRKDMIQIPIFPLKVPYWKFTHWLYADEFSENHTKNIIVRESIRAHVPSAGVGTAFYRNALELIACKETGLPFSTESLTEDYRTSLAIRVHQLKQIFVTQHVLRTQWKKSWFSGGYVQKLVKETVAVRALFPLEYRKAVRQKARWIIGIVFQEWQQGLWPSEWRVRYTLIHDRKSFITHFINGFSYLVFSFWVLYGMFTYANPVYPSLQEQFNLHPWVWWLIVIATFMMGERLLQRTIATYRIYGVIPASLVIPRAFYGNILNLHALIRAYLVYFKAPKSKSKSHHPAWDKTEHHFPGSHMLVPFRQRLGDLLLAQDLVDIETLHTAVLEQQRTGERLGQILCRSQAITPMQLTQLLADQYHLPRIDESQLQAGFLACKETLPEKKVRWLIKQGVIPVFVDTLIQTIQVAIEDPTNELLLGRIINHLMPYRAQFVLRSYEV